MTTKRIPTRLLFILVSSLLISSCSKFIPSGMPTAVSWDAPKPARPVAGKSYKLIPITYSLVSKSRAHRNSTRPGKATGIGGYQYRIGSQDILSVTVWDHPELTIPAGEFRSATAAGHRVSKDGKFFFPFAGKVQAKGLTTDQVRKDLEKRLAKYITKPQVGVSIAAYRSQKAFISGEVKKAGTFPINDVPLTVRDMIATSGGLTKNASNTALLVHHNKSIHINLDALMRKGDNTQNYILRGSDSLHISQHRTSSKVFVMGEVNNAGSVPFDRFGLTLAEALSEAGSINEETANPTGIFVIRNENNKIPSVYQLRTSSVHSILLAEQFKLRPRDIIYVTATPLVRWNRIISRILPSINSLNTASDINNN